VCLKHLFDTVASRGVGQKRNVPGQSGTHLKEMGVYHYVTLFILPNDNFTLLNAELNFDTSSTSYKNFNVRVS
jgi:hypothetical protein